MANQRIIMMDLSIIIVNYNTAEYIRNCLKSLFEFTLKTHFEVIVIDNNSPDREIEKLPGEFPEVKFLFRKTNDGFGSGCNHGASVSVGKYLAFINPDIIFESDCLSGLVKYMETESNTGVCSPLMKDFSNKLNYIYNYFPDYNWEFHEATGIGNDKKVMELLSEFSEKNKLNRILEVDWVTGACMAIRSELFNQLNGFDEDYFLYYEDTDLQYRVSKKGYKIVCLKDLEVKHFTNSSIRSDKGVDVYFFHINRSKLLYMYKHFNFFKRNIIRLFFITGILIRIVALPFRTAFANKKDKRFRQYKRMLKIYLSGYRSILNSKLKES